MNNFKKNDLADIWQSALTHFEKNFTAQIYDTWVKSTIPLSISDTAIELGVPKKFIKEWFESRHIPTFKDAFKAVTNREFEVIFTNIDTEENNNNLNDSNSKDQDNYVKFLENIDNFSIKDDTSLTVDTSQDITTNDKEITKTSANSNKKENNDTSYPLNPKYVFSTFVVGNSNRLAHAASLAVAEAPSQIYNPFFIYGDVGLGKTHLMHAIGNSIKENHPNMNVVYISSEKFTNELINSILNGEPESFRQRYRYVDVLLVDDIQFLAKKERTQEEFFHTFNILYGNNKQIIISSDRPPREIETLESRLRSRFESGLITDISKPDLETRIAVLRKKAMLQNLNIQNEVIIYIASRIENNIRELEGAFIRVIAYASLNKRHIDVNLATEALQNIFPQGGVKQITIDHIKEVVAYHFKIKIEDLSAKNRTRNITYPRQIAMYLCRELTSLSLPKIGEAFGGRDHTTVIHSHEKIDREKSSDIKLSNTIKELTKKIEA